MTQEKINIFDISTLDDQMMEIPSGEIELRDDRTKDRWTVEKSLLKIGSSPTENCRLDNK